MRERPSRDKGRASHRVSRTAPAAIEGIGNTATEVAVVSISFFAYFDFIGVAMKVYEKLKSGF